MELEELTAYAEEKHHIREQYKWSDFPGFSVLADPETGKWAALLMRQWDSQTGTMLQRCDIRCGRDASLMTDRPYLGRPFRMKGLKWVGIYMEQCTQPEVVFRLFDRALQLHREMAMDRTIRRGLADTDRQDAATIVLQEISPSSGAWTDTPLPGANAGAPLPGVYTNAPLPAVGSVHKKTEVPEKIRGMMRLYEYADGSDAAKYRNFYRQGKYMEDYEDHEAWNGEFRHYFPTYHDLNLRQLRGYFTWRTWIRSGMYRPAAGSFAYIYLYELLCGIGTSSPEDALEKMQSFEEGFVDAGYGDERMKKNLRRWMPEYAILRDLPLTTVRALTPPETLARDEALAVLKSPGEYEDEAVFSAIAFFERKNFAETPVAAKYGVRGKGLFAAAWREGIRRGGPGGRDLFTACFGQACTLRWYPLANAVYWEEERHGDAVFELDPCRRYICRDGRWQEERYEELFFDRETFRLFVHEVDRLLRKYLKTGRYLKENPAGEWVHPLAEAAIRADKARLEEAARPRISIDFSGLERIRRDSDLTRDSLLTQEQMQEQMQEQVQEQIQEQPQEQIQEQIREQMQGQIRAETRPAGAKQAREEMFYAGLDGVHMQILRALLADETPAGLIRSARLMPTIVTDTINEAFMDEIGDNILECEGDDIRFVEDYREDVRRILSSD